MNHAAQFVLRVLGAVLVIFAVDIVLSPWFGREPAKPAADNMATLIVAFVGILAKTGVDAAKESMEKGEKGEQQTP